MFWAFAFEGMRQEKHHAAESAPLVFGARDELVDDHLGRVDEVAVLGFPEDEAFGVVERVAVLETHRAGFAEGTVDDVDASLAFAEVVEDSVLVIIYDVVEDGMSLAERAAFGVLAGKAYGVTFDRERGEGEC